ncbi:MAG: hypothetical protein ACKOC5_05110 [Chloroflexota bacterium]
MRASPSCAGQDYYDAAGAWLDGQLGFWRFLYGEPTPFPAVEQRPAFRVGAAPLPTHGPVFRGPYSVQRSFYVGPSSAHPQAGLAFYNYLTRHPAGLPGAPVRRSKLDDPAWIARVGAAEAAAVKTAMQQVYTQPLRFGGPLRPVDPLINYLFAALQDYLNGSNAQLVMQIAQSKADRLAACLGDPTGLDQQALEQAVRSCARQVEPDTGW